MKYHKLAGKAGLFVLMIGLGMGVWGRPCQAAEIICENNQIAPDEDGKYQVSFVVDEENAYAGNEFCVSCSDGVVVEEVSYEQLNVHVGDDAATSVNVTYSTVEDASTVITIRKAGDSKESFFEGTSFLGVGGKYIHEITVTGLEPYTEYEYTVGDGFNSKNGTFKTALAKGDNQEFSFVYIADTQVSNESNAKALGATLAEINNMNPDLVYIAGDVTDKAANESQWEWLFNNAGAYPNGGEDMFANTLLAVTQGNHDNNEMNQHINAPEEAGKIVYSFDYGCAKFIILNLEAARYSEDARAQQEAYLREQVAQAKENGQWTIVGFHKSLYTGASHIVDSDIISARTFWSPIFAELDIDMVLQGHDHVYSRGFVDETGTGIKVTADENGVVTAPDNAPLYMVGGHAGGLKWYSKKNYTVSEGDPLTLNYSFLDVNSTDTGSDVKKEQVITEFKMSESTFTMNCYMFKYDTDTDQITTEKYLYDTLTVERDMDDTVTTTLKGDTRVVLDEADTVSYYVAANRCNNANAFQADLSYNTDVLELVEAKSVVDNTIFTDIKDENGVASVIVGLSSPLSVETSTNIVQYTFKIKNTELKNITTNLVESSIAVLEYAEDGTLQRAKDVDPTQIVSEINTEFYSYEGASDIDQDGKITLADLAIALTYYQSTEQKAYDINLDGIVDILDYVIIADMVRQNA